MTRAFKTTLKQMRRSGWLAWASVAVMTLAFFITTVFLLLAFVLNLVLRSIESDPHIYVFFRAGTNEHSIQEIRDEWLQLPNVETIDYTSEDQALQEFRAVNEKTNPITAEAIREDVLPASLGIRLVSIQQADTIIQLVENEKEANEDVLDVGYSQTVIDNIKEIVNLVRLGGGIIMALLIIVMVLFSLLTVEFRIFNRSEEIGIMQLVGGSLWYIRLPFILESAIYGVLGALISNLILIGSYFGVLNYYSQSNLIQFIYRFFGNLPWPTITIHQLIALFLGTLLIGALLGAFNSFIAIRRYIK